MRLPLALFGLPLFAVPPSFTPRDAIRAEWHRQVPTLREAERAGLSPTDHDRLELALARIGSPGAPALLPAELDKPTLEIWEAKATAARTPQERFTALFFLNRLKSAKALFSIEGLAAKDAESWPKHLHLEAQIATARLNGCEVSFQLQGFLDALQRAGKIDPVRAQAAQLRLVMAGKEKELLPPVKATAGSLLALMDAWNRAPWEKRSSNHLRLWWAAAALEIPPPPGKGSRTIDLSPQGLRPSMELSPREKWALWSRIWDGLPDDLNIAPEEWPGAVPKIPRTIAIHRFPRDPLMPISNAEFRQSYLDGLCMVVDPIRSSALLPTLRKTSPVHADRLRNRMFSGPDPIARAAAIEDMTEAPADLDALIKRLWKVEEYDGVQVLIQSLEKWKLPEERRRTVLARFYEHPCWTARLDAWRELSKLDAKAPWPTTPRPNATDAAILQEAERLAVAGKPVRMRLHFAGRRVVTLRLDPVNAPMNVANLVLLARKGFFNGRRVPRVVPDFVVQMGSPVDTMDGGPGYTVRCENSLDWYGPGSVGMALSGKDTGGSQFFITTNAAPHLTGRYTRVGQVEDQDQALKILDDLELGARLERVEILEPH